MAHHSYRNNNNSKKKEKKKATALTQAPFTHSSCVQGFDAKLKQVRSSRYGQTARHMHGSHRGRVGALASGFPLSSATCVCGRGLTSVGLHVLQQVVVELELDATGTTSVGF